MIYFVSIQARLVVRFLRFDPMISGSNPPSAELSLGVVRVATYIIPGIGITKCGYIKRKDADTTR